jgi:uncharacterized membrane protein YcaP (DUF421 family)
MQESTAEVENVETLGVTIFHLVAIMTVLLGIWLLMGKRQIGEFSPLDFAISITIGTIAGAGIVDTRINLAGVLVSIVMLGLLQITVSWLSLKNRRLQYKVNFEPTVMVEKGIIIKKNLRKVRLSLETLLQLLREKGVFNINEVELAILEPLGRLSVLRKPEYQPLTSRQVQIIPEANEILAPVILDGELQTATLKQLGFSDSQIEEFIRLHGDKLHHIFVAFMDKNRKLYVMNDDAKESGLFLH